MPAPTACMMNDSTMETNVADNNVAELVKENPMEPQRHCEREHRECREKFIHFAAFAE